MKNAKQPVIKDAVLVGAGHGHVAVLRMFGMRPIPGVPCLTRSRRRFADKSGAWGTLS